MRQDELGNKVAEIRLHPIWMNLVAVPPAVITVLSFLWLVARLEPDDDSALWTFPVALLLFLPLLAIHEFLHGMTAVVWGRLRWRDIRFAVVWKTLAPMCHVKAPLRVPVAKAVGLAPLVGTALPIIVLLLWYPSELTALLASFVVIGCFADVYMVYRLRRFDRSMWVVDHPTEGGFDIYAAEPAPQGPEPAT